MTMTEQAEGILTGEVEIKQGKKYWLYDRENGGVCRVKVVGFYFNNDPDYCKIYAISRKRHRLGWWSYKDRPNAYSLIHFGESLRANKKVRDSIFVKAPHLNDN